MMRNLLLSLAFLLVTATTHAADSPCENGYWTPRGDVMKTVKAWDEMINGLGNKKEWATTINKFGKVNGLPLYVDMKSDETKEFPDRLEAEGPDGRNATVFLKKLKMAPKSVFSADEVIEVKSAKNKSAIMKWPAPANATAPIVTVDGDELIVQQDLTPICSGHAKKTVWLGIKPSGEVRVLVQKPVKDPTPISECPAAHAAMPDSSYSACEEVTDLQLHTKHILVFEQPMT
jgi:hypothetical protein